MPLPGREEQTLVYRVELDESSLSEVIRSARDAVGVAMESAVNAGVGAADTTHLTAATALARTGSHLEFLRSHVPGMQQHADVIAGAQGMTIAQALGVKAGLVAPRFSESMQSLNWRAQKRIDEGLGFDSLDVMQWTSTAALTATSFLTGGLLPSLIAGYGIDAGIDQVRNRKMLESHLMALGKGPASQVVRRFEEQVRNMGGIGFAEASQVAAAAATNMNVRTMSAHQVEEVLTQAVGDWRATGKALGLEKEAALATVTDMMRTGIMPGQISQVVGGAAGLAQSLGGAQPHLVADATMQFARGAQVQGFDAFAAANSFQLQAGTIAEMLRSGTLRRSELTAAAGFSGPQADQVMAATQNMIGETLRFAQTGFGTLVAAGMRSGARGFNINELGAAAMGMSTQQLLEFDGQLGSMSEVAGMQQALATTARDVITGVGGDVTQASLQAQLMRMGMSQGAARVLAAQELNPAGRGRAAARQMRGAIDARIEASPRANMVERGFALAQSGAGNVVDYAHSGVDARAYLSGGGMLPARHVMGLLNQAGGPGGGYYGARGVGDFIGDVTDTTLGELGRDVREYFDEGPYLGDVLTNPSLAPMWIIGMMGAEPDRSASEVSTTVLTRRELEGMGTRRFRRLVAGLADVDRAFMREVGTTGAAAGPQRVQFLKKQQGDLIRELRDSDPATRQRVYGDVRRLRSIAGIEVGTGDMLKLVATSQRFRDRLQGASDEERQKIENELANTIESMGGYEEADTGAIAGFLLGDQVQSRLSRTAADRVVQLQQQEGIENAVMQATGSREQRKALAERIFGSTTSEAAKRFINTDGMSAEQLRNLVEEGAGATGSGLSKEYRRSISSLTKAGRSIGEAALMQIGLEGAMQGAEVRAERPEEPEKKPDAGGGGGGLSALLTKMDELIQEIRLERRSRE